jgi:hypothetical protein
VTAAPAARGGREGEALRDPGRARRRSGASTGGVIVVDLSQFSGRKVSVYVNGDEWGHYVLQCALSLRDNYLAVVPRFPVFVLESLAGKRPLVLCGGSVESVTASAGGFPRLDVRVLHRASVVHRRRPSSVRPSSVRTMARNPGAA